MVMIYHVSKTTLVKISCLFADWNMIRHNTQACLVEPHESHKQQTWSWGPSHTHNQACSTILMSDLAQVKLPWRSKTGKHSTHGSSKLRSMEDGNHLSSCGPSGYHSGRRKPVWSIPAGSTQKKVNLCQERWSACSPPMSTHHITKGSYSIGIWLAMFGASVSYKDPNCIIMREQDG